MLNVTVWEILSGVLVTLLIIVFLSQKNNLGKPQGNHRSLLKYVFIIIILGGITSAAFYFLTLPRPNPAVPSLPLTGPAPTPYTSAWSINGLYATPIDGVITFSLLSAIILLAAIMFYDLRVRKTLEKNLAHEKITTNDALDKLQIKDAILADQIKALTVINKAMVRRELKMIELKKEIGNLHEQAKTDHDENKNDRVN